MRNVKAARIRIEQPPANATTFLPSAKLTKERGAFVVPLGKAGTQINISEKKR